VTRAVQIGGVEELVGSLGQAQMISQVAQSQRSARGQDFRIPVHVNINMSMARMGIFYESDLEEISNLPGVQIKGLMSHFSNAYERDPEKAKRLSFEDMAKFDRMVDNFESRDPVVIHLANSSSTLRWPEARRDMVRVGSGILRGNAPRELRDSIDLWPPVVAIKSTVALVMENVPPGSTVGYESTYTTDPDKPSRLAALRFGHANGYPAEARNSGYVLIRGQRFPIVGRISQNLTVVNVTDEDPRNRVQMGDEVVLLGPQGNDRITINELLEWIGETRSSVGSAILVSLMVRNPKVAVEGLASKLDPRHLVCGLCVNDDEQ
jgi:alanine racemase